MKTQLINLNLKKIKTINKHKKGVNSICLFPSGNIVSVSDDKSILIFDTNYSIIQEIKNAHDGWIYYVKVKNETNFITCSYDKSIKFWIKEQNNKFFKLNEKINNAHNEWILKVLYHPNGNLISCSNDKTIKIWEEKNNNTHECVTIIKFQNQINSILLLENKNILIGCEIKEILFFNSNNYNLLFKLKDAGCWKWNAMCQIDDNRIIVGGINVLMKVISINEKKIIKTIDNMFICYGICVIENRGIFLTGGWSFKINIFRNDNYECIQSIDNAHYTWIRGIIELNNNIIASYSDDGIINCWFL